MDITVTCWSVRVTIVAVEKQQVLHILSVSVALVIQHDKSHVLYYSHNGKSGSTIFFHKIS